MDIASCKLLGFSLVLFLSMADYCSASRVMSAPEAEGQGYKNEAIGEQGLDHTEGWANHAAGKEHGVVCYGTSGNSGWAGGGTSYSSGGGHGGGMAYGAGDAWAGYNSADGYGYGYGFGGGSYGRGGGGGGGSHGGYAP